MLDDQIRKLEKRIITLEGIATRPDQLPPTAPKRYPWPSLLSQWGRGVGLSLMMYFGIGIMMIPLAVPYSLSVFVVKDAEQDWYHYLFGVLYIVGMLVWGPIAFFKVFRWIVAEFPHWLIVKPLEAGSVGELRVEGNDHASTGPG